MVAWIDPSPVRFLLGIIATALVGFYPAGTTAYQLGTKHWSWDTVENRRKIEQLCVRDWPNDPRMREACERNQWWAIDELAERRVPFDIDAWDFERMRKFCERNWPNDFSLWVACERNQIRAIRILKDPPPVPYELKEVVRQRCKAEWPDDFSMRVACEQNAGRQLRKP